MIAKHVSTLQRGADLLKLNFINALISFTAYPWYTHYTIQFCHKSAVNYPTCLPRLTQNIVYVRLVNIILLYKFY